MRKGEDCSRYLERGYRLPVQSPLFVRLAPSPGGEVTLEPGRRVAPYANNDSPSGCLEMESRFVRLLGLRVPGPVVVEASRKSCESTIQRQSTTPPIELPPT